MSPGRQCRGFSGCDGSTLKNTSVSFPPACALVSLTFRPTIFHFLCFTSCQRISSLWVFSAYISLLTHYFFLCDLLAKAKYSLSLSKSKQLLSQIQLIVFLKWTCLNKTQFLDPVFAFQLLPFQFSFSSSSLSSALSLEICNDPLSFRDLQQHFNIQKGEGFTASLFCFTFNCIDSRMSRS